MGYDTIYYWPRITVAKDGDEDTDDTGDDSDN